MCVCKCVFLMVEEILGEFVEFAEFGFEHNSARLLKPVGFCGEVGGW